MSLEDFIRLKAFVRHYFDWFMAGPGMNLEDHPIFALEALEKRSISQAKRGLEMAINDSVERTSDWR